MAVGMGMGRGRGRRGGVRGKDWIENVLLFLHVARAIFSDQEGG